MAPAKSLDPPPMRRPRRLLLAVVGILALALTPAIPAAAVASPPSPGAPGIGDPYYPLAGNGGYDVVHYGLDIDYKPADGRLTGTALITSKATQNLSAFNLDLHGLTVKNVTVNARTVKWSRAGDELTIVPKTALKKGKTFVTTVTYSGVPGLYDDPVLGDAGFFKTDDGALVVGQPWVAASWFPVNDHPADKALYSIRITVPKGVEAISNGRLVWHGDLGGKANWIWNVDKPMASYLATATIGQFDLDQGSAGGIRYLDAIDPDLSAPPVTAHTGTQFAWSEQADDSYKRLARTVTVPADDPELTFWMNRSVEDGWDFVTVEAAPSGTDDWTTLPDRNGATTQTTSNESCPGLLPQHPFLAHYLSDPGDGSPCLPTGTTGEWWAATGDGDGWQQWSVDLSQWAGQSVDLAISYVSDYAVQHDGVSIDDIAGLGGTVSTSFEADADPLDGWTVPGAPEGSPGNANDWIATADGPPSIGDRVRASFSRQPEILDFLADSFGPYPFRDAGGIVDDLPGLGFALENQTRPIYAPEFFQTQSDGDTVVVHELAHQWFGDDVALERWSDIWLNEGFATYAEWLWSEHEGNGTPQDIFDYYLGAIPDDDPFWTLPPGDPGPEALFDDPVYIRGAMTLHALRTQVGDDVFWKIVRTWASSHSRGNGTTAEFIALADKISGQSLDDLFQTWLVTPSKPVVASPFARTFSVAPAIKPPGWFGLPH